jgi:hypothetical protein
MRRSHGSSVVELTLAVGVASFGMLVMTAMQVEAHRASHRSPQADAIAAAEMAHLRELPWEELAETNGYQVANWVRLPGQAPGDVSTTVELPGTLKGAVERIYSVQWRVSEVETSARRVEVRVMWTDFRQHPRTHVLAELRTPDTQLL